MTALLITAMSYFNEIMQGACRLKPWFRVTILIVFMGGAFFLGKWIG